MGNGERNVKTGDLELQDLRKCTISRQLDQSHKELSHLLVQQRLLHSLINVCKAVLHLSEVVEASILTMRLPLTTVLLRAHRWLARQSRRETFFNIEASSFLVNESFLRDHELA